MLTPERSLASGAPAPVVTEAEPAVPERSAAPRGQRWIYAFIITEFVCSLALLVQQLAAQRVVFRSLAIGLSLVFLVLLPRRTAAPVRHPASPWAVAALVVITLSAFNPNGGAPLAVMAHALLYFAVLGPLFWVTRLDIDEHVLGRLLIILWVYNSASAVFGLLQVYFPGRFLSTQVEFISAQRNLNIRLASGEWVPRPSGLSDAPGGAGPGGFYATLFGLGVVLTKPFRGATLIGLLTMIVGMMCIYLSQVRAVVVMLGVCFVTLAGLLLLSGRISGVVGAAVLGTVVVLLSFELAFAVGGQMVVDRMVSLVQGAPVTVYNQNRGMLLEDDFLSRLPSYPLGAGLGHWGMMNLYFGSREHELGAELQWGGWILDGGVPLVIAYVGAMLAAIGVAFRAALRAPDASLRNWAAIVTAYDVGTLAICFSYAPFIGTAGLDFWLVNALLFRAVPRAAPSAGAAPRRADRRGYFLPGAGGLGRRGL